MASLVVSASDEKYEKYVGGYVIFPAVLKFPINVLSLWCRENKTTINLVNLVLQTTIIGHI